MALVRIIDANANRASEGLRVIEDFARFALDDRFLTSGFKELRHDLAHMLAAIPESQRLMARETTGDVGTRIAARDEYERANLHEIALVNQKRVEQALRCIEEYAKAISADMAAQIEGLRYRTYTLSRAIHVNQQSRRQLNGRQLYVLIDAGTSPESLAAFGRHLSQAGVHVLQLRDKSLCDRELLIRARALREATRDLDTTLIMNDRVDLALMADADGVHLGQSDLPVKEARSLLGPDRLIGVSTHSLSQACQAVLEGANYIGCGPTFPSTTKHFASFPGTDFLREVSRQISLPAFAIGGISAANLDEVLQAGFSRIAVSGAVTGAEDPAGIVRQFVSRLQPRVDQQSTTEAQGGTAP
jgi:thiamine-phosphate pyrophosphorylase